MRLYQSTWHALVEAALQIAKEQPLFLHTLVLAKFCVFYLKAKVRNALPLNHLRNSSLVLNSVQN
jgi:hypothetical protein